MTRIRYYFGNFKKNYNHSTILVETKLNPLIIITLRTLKTAPYMKDFRSALSDGIILFDGGMGSELYNRGIYFNRSFEELNLSSPSLIKQVHRDFIKAGANVIETNTFGANRIKLMRDLLSDKIYDINYQGAKIAKETAQEDCYVAGAIGPLGSQIEPLGPISLSEAKDYFKEQIQALVDGGVDLLVFETFIYPNELNQAISAAREICKLPIIAEFTIDEDCRSLTGSPSASIIKELLATQADIIGANCTVGPQTMLEWLERARPLTDKPLVIMPNAGKPKNIEGRNFYIATPEYFSEFTRHFINAGANIVGGCCGVTPEHTKKMRQAITSLIPNIKFTRHEEEPSITEKEQPKIPQDKKSRLAKRMSDSRFVKLVELVSPHGISANNEIEKAQELYNYGIDAINIPDGPRASARMSALALAMLIKSQVGIEPILHYVCRDRNVIGMQSDLLGAYALGIRNILALTGDPPKLGSYPDATGVFDIDSIGLVNVLSRLNSGLDIAGNPINQPTGYFVGVGANPTAINWDEEIKRLEFKIEAGAEYIITQPVFDEKAFEAFIKRIEQYKIPLIAGIWPLVSLRNVDFLNNEVPGCFVPDYIKAKFRAVEGDKKASQAIGIEIARDTLKNYKSSIQGVQISLPFGRVSAAIEILDGIAE